MIFYLSVGKGKDWKIDVPSSAEDVNEEKEPVVVDESVAPQINKLSITANPACSIQKISNSKKKRGKIERTFLKCLLGFVSIRMRNFLS